MAAGSTGSHVTPAAMAFRGDVAAQSREVAHALVCRRSRTGFLRSVGPSPSAKTRADQTTLVAPQAAHPEIGAGYRRLPTGWDCAGEPLRHAAVPLQWEQIRSPAHSLWKVAWQRRHWRTLGATLVG